MEITNNFICKNLRKPTQQPGPCHPLQRKKAVAKRVHGKGNISSGSSLADTGGYNAACASGPLAVGENNFSFMIQELQ